jgi:hypothetical protein
VGPAVEKVRPLDGWKFGGENVVGEKWNED